MSDSEPGAPSLKTLSAGAFHALVKVKPIGTLVARRQISGAIAFYWRYSHGTTSERVLIGLYDPASPPKRLEPTQVGYSIAAATRAAETMAIEHYQARPAGGRPAMVKARKDAEEKTAQTKARAFATTLERLLTSYCDYLETRGRRSHRDARSIFDNHVFTVFPTISSKQASEVTPDDFADMMRKLHDSGKGRTANKLRSYARAAYQVAKDARLQPGIPASFKEFGVVANPVAETKPDSASNRAQRQPLDLRQMRTYWKLIKDMPGFRGGLLRLHLLTGGQRIEQLVKLKTADIRKDSFTLFDGKGRPGSAPREHIVPLTKESREALKVCGPKGEYALSTDGGETHVAATTLSDWAAAVAAPRIKGFSAKHLRSGVETVLASAEVAKEIRGRLQSHGITGVQARHYDGHDYLPQKRRALATLRALICIESNGERRQQKHPSGSAEAAENVGTHMAAGDAEEDGSLPACVSC